MKKKVITIFIMIILIAASGFISFLNGRKSVPIKTDSHQEKIDVKEKEITDQDTIERIKEIDNKIDYLYLNTNKNDKIGSIIKYMFNNPEYTHKIVGSRVRMDTSFNPPLIENNSSDEVLVEDQEFDYITLDDLIIEYKNIFNEDLDKTEVLATYYFDNNIVKRYITDDNKNIFIQKERESQNIEYIRDNFKYYEDDNYYYIYYNAEIKDAGTVYRGTIDYELNKGNRSEIKEMDSSNYDDFSLVKVYYKKEGNNIYYEKSEIIRE
mgnify:CR=1 FL=1